MLVHLRLTVPTVLSDDVRRVLTEAEHVTNIVVLPGASLRPEGDLVECDLPRESTDTVMQELERLGLSEVGGVVVETPASAPFAKARELEEQAPGDPEDAVIWETVVAQAESASRPAFSYRIFMVLATLLAAIAVITDSPVLVVGAMVVGPEFGTVAAVCTGLVLGRWVLVGRSLRLLATTFALAILVVAALALAADVTGLVAEEMVRRPRPQTDFIWHPDRWSFVVALVAGAAGVLALSTDRAQALVGVFISVTTVPAAGNLALALGTWTPEEVVGSGTQLGVNLAGMVLSGTVVLAVQRVLGRRRRAQEGVAAVR